MNAAASGRAIVTEIVMVPNFYSASLPLLGKIVIAGISAVGLILFVRSYIRNGRL